MSKKLLSFISILLIVSCALVQKNTQQQEEILPPIAKKIPDTLRIHDTLLVDNYSWLKDKTRSDEEVIDYLESENSYTEKLLDNKELQNSLYEEIIGRIQQTDLSVPVLRDSFYYYWKDIKGEQYSIYCRKRHIQDNTEEIVLDINKLAQPYEYFDVSNLRLSPDQNRLAYMADTTGSENYTMYIKNLKSDTLLYDTANNVGNLCWGNDSIMYYIKEDISGRPYKVYRHKLNNDINDDVLIYEEANTAFYVYMYRSRSDEYVMLTSGSKTTSEVRYLKTDNLLSDFKVVQPRIQGVEYSIYPHLEDFYIVTNEGDAINNKIMRANFSNPHKSNWELFLPPQKGCELNLSVFRDYLIVYEMKAGLEKMKVMDLKKDSTYYIQFSDSLYDFSVWGNYNFETEKLRFTYESFTTPPRVIEYNLDTHEKKILKKREVLGDYNSEDYTEKRVFATAKDGTRIPISLVYKADLFKEKNGTQSVYLSGYGAYGGVAYPYFSYSRISLLDRGIIYALAHVRGGGEYGEKWYDQGKMLNKRNTFTDFIACAEYLIENGYTEPSKLVAEGASAGGLLIGAVANMRPDLFEIIVADVPFVDLINTMLDTTLSATVSEFEEWGNPRVEKQFDYMISYSPYDNVKKQDYPNMLIMGGFYDRRVNYWEPAKWTAKLRDMKTDENILALKINMAGHAGASGRYDFFREIAFEYAFILDLLEVE
ncbi:MAG: S9 family peptidase [Candidatus Cloacimonetes bacterium]|nr:S9 family peptidase [Candidatus Cloacimonadota bacterium]